MLYDDPDEDLITPEAYEEALAADVARAGALLWVGLSFEQSASVEHFRRARRALQAAGRDTAQVPQVVVNPDGDALFNVASAARGPHISRISRISHISHIPPLPRDHTQRASFVTRARFQTAPHPPQIRWPTRTSCACCLPA